MFPNNPQFLRMASVKERLMGYSVSIVDTGLSSSFSTLRQNLEYQGSEFVTQSYFNIHLKSMQTYKDFCGKTRLL